MDDERFEITYRICYELDKVGVTYDDVRMNLDGNVLDSFRWRLLLYMESFDFALPNHDMRTMTFVLSGLEAKEFFFFYGLDFSG